MLIGNNGFIKVLLAQNTGLLVSLDCVGAVILALCYAKVLVAYETESISMSPPMYRDKSPIELAR